MHLTTTIESHVRWNIILMDDFPIFPKKGVRTIKLQSFSGAGKSLFKTQIKITHLSQDLAGRPPEWWMAVCPWCCTTKGCRTRSCSHLPLVDDWVLGVCVTFVCFFSWGPDMSASTSISSNNLTQKVSY